MDEHYLTPDVWLRSIQDDYMKTYLKEGGASVKIVVADAEECARVRTRLQSLASSNNFQYAQVDAATRRTHLVHNLFTAAADQVAWEDLAREFLRRSLEEKHYQVPTSGDLAVEALAEANDEAKDLLMRD